MFVCNMCGVNEVIESENPNLSVMDVNTAVVTAVLNSGQGFAQLDIFSAIMNMPLIWVINYTKNVNKFSSETAWMAMAMAAKEEAKVTIDSGDFNSDGSL